MEDEYNRLRKEYVKRDKFLFVAKTYLYRLDRMFKKDGLNDCGKKDRLLGAYMYYLNALRKMLDELKI